MKLLGPVLSVADIWPADRPLPTAEQMEQAEGRMRKEAAENYAAGYQGDWGFTLSLTMFTYHRALWWHLFFPNEKLTIDWKPTA